MIIGEETTITVSTQGRVSILDIGWYYMRSRAGIKYRNPINGRPISIEQVGLRDMLRLSTNYPPEHSITVEPTQLLRLWEGGAVEARRSRDRQLYGMYGMYVVKQTKQVYVMAYRVENITSIGGIYHDAGNGWPGTISARGSRDGTLGR